MANVVWANQAGNWTNTAIWSYWDELTQSIQLYGQVPQVDDVVYCNGYIIMFNADINIGNGYIRNDVNPYTNLNGGYIQADMHDVSQSLSINANLLAYNDIVVYLYGTGNYNVVWIYNINGNVKGVNQYAIRFAADGIRLTINGNIYGMFYHRTSRSGPQSHTLIINGNVTQSDNSYLIGAANNSFGSVTINGNYSTATLPSQYKQPLFTINGRFTPKNGMKFDRNTTINGIIDVTQNNSVLPIDNSYYILTQSGITMITSTDYPAENNVKYGVPYDKGRLVGTFQPDYPQQANVFTDVEYARILTVADDITLYSGDTYRYNGTTWSLLQTIGETSTDVTAVVDTDALIGFLGTTTTNIVTTPSTNPVTIDGNSVTAQTDEYVRYGVSVYQWDGSAWALAYTDQRSNPTIIINGSSVTAVDGDIVMYDNNCYRWDAILTLWVKLSYVGETTTDISDGSTRNMLFIIGESMKGTLNVSLPQILLDRLANCVTVDILDAQLNAKL